MADGLGSKEFDSLEVADLRSIIRAEVGQRPGQSPAPGSARQTTPRKKALPPEMDERRAALDSLARHHRAIRIQDRAATMDRKSMLDALAEHQEILQAQDAATATRLRAPAARARALISANRMAARAVSTEISQGTQTAAQIVGRVGSVVGVGLPALSAAGVAITIWKVFEHQYNKSLERIKALENTVGAGESPQFRTISVAKLNRDGRFPAVSRIDIGGLTAEEVIYYGKQLNTSQSSFIGRFWGGVFRGEDLKTTLNYANLEGARAKNAAGITVDKMRSMNTMRMRADRELSDGGQVTQGWKRQPLHGG